MNLHGIPALLGRRGGLRNSRTVIRNDTLLGRATLSAKKSEYTARQSSTEPLINAATDITPVNIGAGNKSVDGASAAVPANGPPANESQPHPLPYLRLLGVARGV
jgi:hypothetical protein